MKTILRPMKTTLFLTLVFGLLTGAASEARASAITLSGINTGHYWWDKQQWSGGSDTQSGFSYGDDVSGLIHAQSNYQYYGGANRDFNRKDAYFQIDLSSLAGIDMISATFKFYVTENNTSAETFLKHLTIQSTTPTGDAAQQLAGMTDVASSTTFTVGWNSIDLTSYIQSDLAQGYAFTVLNIPQFNQEQDENRLLSLYGGSAAAEYRPHLDVTVVPEPSTYALLASGAVLALAALRRRHNRRTLS